MTALVTGSAGTLGTALCERLRGEGWEVLGLDLVDGYDVTRYVVTPPRLDVIFHLAAAKHAPEGELDPWHVANTNIVGTRNVLAAGVRTILASTCKAADPETVYGASKLIAERMTLEAGGSVARFYNVRESSGNVFETWRNLPEDAPIPVTACWRRFMDLDQALDLLMACVDLPAGRYTVDPPEAVPMWHVADTAYPRRPQVVLERRRGDRICEPARASSEKLIYLGNGIRQIVSAHDATAVREQVAA